jgi:integrase
VASLRFKKDGTPFIDFRAEGKRYRPEFERLKDAQKFLNLADADPKEALKFWLDSLAEPAVEIVDAEFFSLVAKAGNFKAHYCAKRTNVVDMRKIMDRFVAFVLIRKKAKDCCLTVISMDDLEAFQEHLAESGIVAASVNRYFATIKTFFKRMQRAGYIKVNFAPLVEGLEEEHKKRPVWKDGDTEKLVGELLKREWDTVLVYIAKSMEFTPFGPKDFRRLTWQKMDLAHGIVRTFRMKGKGKRDWDVPIALGYHKLLLEIRNRQLEQGTWQEDGFVYLKESGKPINPTWVSKSFERARKAVGIECVPYTSRHRVINKVDKAFDLKTASRFAGHASTKTTERHYVVQEDEEFNNKVKEAFAE